MTRQSVIGLASNLSERPRDWQWTPIKFSWRGVVNYGPKAPIHHWWWQKPLARRGGIGHSNIRVKRYTWTSIGIEEQTTDYRETSEECNCNDISRCTACVLCVVALYDRTIVARSGSRTSRYGTRSHARETTVTHRCS